MTRTITCESEKDADRFSVLFAQFCFGRMLALQVDSRGEQKREDRRADLAVLRALEQVSDPILGAGPTHGGVIPRELRPGSVLTLKQADMDRLEKYVNRAPCDTAKLGELEDALDWLSAADKVDE